MGSFLSLSQRVEDGERRGKGGEGRRRVRGRLRLGAERRRWKAKRRRSLRGPEKCLGRKKRSAKAHADEKERDKPSLRPFAHRHRGLTRVSPVSHPVFPVLLPPSDGERVAKGGGGERTAGVRERATPRMTQVPQSLTRLRLFCHLLLSFELFYRLPR